MHVTSVETAAAARDGVVDVDTGECEGNSYDDFSINAIKTKRNLEDWETIQKDYNIPTEQQSETKEVA